MNPKSRDSTLADLPTGFTVSGRDSTLNRILSACIRVSDTLDCGRYVGVSDLYERYIYEENQVMKIADACLAG